MRRLLPILTSVLVVGLTALPLQAQTLLTPSPTSPSLSGFGGALAVHDGIVFIGEPENRFRPGMVYVYEDGDTWTEAAQLEASDGAEGDPVEELPVGVRTLGLLAGVLVTFVGVLVAGTRN